VNFNGVAAREKRIRGKYNGSPHDSIKRVLNPVEARTTALLKSGFETLPSHANFYSRGPRRNLIATRARPSLTAFAAFRFLARQQPTAATPAAKKPPRPTSRSIRKFFFFNWLRARSALRRSEMPNASTFEERARSDRHRRSVIRLFHDPTRSVSAPRAALT
jgi:hypothetical protein